MSVVTAFPLYVRDIKTLSLDSVTNVAVDGDTELADVSIKKHLSSFACLFQLLLTARLLLSEAAQIV